MKQRLDVLQHKVIDMVKQIEDQSDIIDKLQSTVSAYSNLHAWSHCANQNHRIFDAKIVMQKKGLLSRAPSTSFVPSRNTTSRLLMILLVSFWFLLVKQYALVPSQYPRNTQSMALDSNLLLFSSGMCANVLQPKTLKWDISDFVLVHASCGVFESRALVGHQFLM